MSYMLPLPTTGRLELRVLRGEDAGPLAALVDNPREWVKNKTEQQAELGLGPWAVVERDSRKLVGFCGFFVCEAYGITLGYGILPDARGRGLATEAADAVLTWAEQHNLDVHASIRPPNPASERVLQKIGMQFVERQQDQHGERLVFRRRRTSTRLFWPGCRNVRDLGGLPVLPGGQTRPGALVRADSLDRLTAAGVLAVRNSGVRQILDLRSVWEMPEQPHPFHDDPVYRVIPFVDDSRDHERDRGGERTRADLYRGSVDRNGLQIKAEVVAIATAPRGTVVVHCLSGVDRTGMLVAIVLDALGVDRGAIAADYATSEQELGPTTPGTSASQDGVAEGGRSMPSSILAAAPEPRAILELLEHIDRVHGGVGAYLDLNGVSADQLRMLRDRLVWRLAGAHASSGVD